MKQRPFNITFHHPERVAQQHKVQIGHYFVFVREKLSGTAQELKQCLVKGEGRNEVLPLLDQPVQLEGVTITPTHPLIEPISTVVTERDLYRAEQDRVHLFIAFPKAPKNLRLLIKYNGKSLTEREVQLTNGMAIDTILRS